MHIDPRIFTNVSKINIIKTIQTPNCLKMIPKQLNPKDEIATNIDATTFYEIVASQVPKIAFQEPITLERYVGATCRTSLRHATTLGQEDTATYFDSKHTVTTLLHKLGISTAIITQECGATDDYEDFTRWYTLMTDASSTLKATKDGTNWFTLDDEFLKRTKQCTQTTPRSPFG